MSDVYNHECDFDGSDEVILTIDLDRDIWICTTGDVMLSADSARKLAAELIKFANDVDEVDQ